MEWSVLVETAAPAKAPAVKTEDPRIDDLADLLTEQGGVVGAAQDGRGYSVRLTCQCHGDAASVLEQALSTVESARRKAKLPAWPVSRAEVVRADDLAREVSGPNFPDVIGSAEVIKILGVSRQRLQDLRKKITFPKPITELAATPIWLRSAIDAFKSDWNREPGRPRTSAEIRAVVADDLKRIPRGSFAQNLFRSAYQSARMHGLGSHATIEPTHEAAVDSARDAVQMEFPDFEPTILSAEAARLSGVIKKNTEALSGDKPSSR